MSVWKHNVICEPTDDGTDPLGSQPEDSISYGTHTLPKELWTSGKAGLLRDPDFRARREAKDKRTAKHKLDRGSGIETRPVKGNK